MAANISLASSGNCAHDNERHPEILKCTWTDPSWHTGCMGAVHVRGLEGLQQCMFATEPCVAACAYALVWDVHHARSAPACMCVAEYAHVQQNPVWLHVPTLACKLRPTMYSTTSSISHMEGLLASKPSPLRLRKTWGRLNTCTQKNSTNCSMRPAQSQAPGIQLGCEAGLAAWPHAGLADKASCCMWAHGRLC